MNMDNAAVKLAKALNHFASIFLGLKQGFGGNTLAFLGSFQQISLPAFNYFRKVIHRFVSVQTEGDLPALHGVILIKPFLHLRLGHTKLFIQSAAIKENFKHPVYFFLSEITALDRCNGHSIRFRNKYFCIRINKKAVIRSAPPTAEAAGETLAQHFSAFVFRELRLSLCSRLSRSRSAAGKEHKEHNCR